MNKIPFFIVFLLLIALGILGVRSNSDIENKLISLSSTQALTGEKDIFISPKFSPDGKQLAFTGPRFFGLFIYDLEKNTINKLSDDSGVNFQWLKDGRGLVSESLSGEVIISLLGKPPKVVKSVPVKLSLLVPRTNCFVYIDDVDSKLKIIDLSTGKVRSVIPNQKSFVHKPILSPDNSLILANISDDMLVFSASNGRLITNLGKGSTGGWFPDGKSIVYTVTEDDGHAILGSDIFVVNIDGTNRRQLTNTEDILEDDPSFSTDGSKITYSDLKSGRIYISNIEIVGEKVSVDSQ